MRAEETINVSIVAKNLHGNKLTKTMFKWFMKEKLLEFEKKIKCVPSVEEDLRVMIIWTDTLNMFMKDKIMAKVFVKNVAKLFGKYLDYYTIFTQGASIP